MNTNVNNLSGGDGGIYIADTTANTGKWFGIYCIANCEFSTLTSNITDLPDDLVLTAGQAIYGTFTAITLASGSVIAYNKQ
jgi:hypothetical protein